jgi:hypothetical protein
MTTQTPKDYRDDQHVVDEEMDSYPTQWNTAKHIALFSIPVVVGIIGFLIGYIVIKF